MNRPLVSRLRPVLVRLLLGGLLCLLTGAARAQVEAPPAPSGNPVLAVAQLRELFSEITRSIEAFGAGNASLVAVGRRTAVTLFGVLLVWGIVKSWILGKGMAQLLPEFLQPVVILGLAFWAVDHLGPAVRDSVGGLGQVFSSTLSLPGGVPTEFDVIDRMAVAAFDVATAAPSGPGGEWSNVVSAVANQTLGRLYRLVAACVLLVSGAVAAGVMLMAKVQTSLAILFAPVMIPWAMWPPSAFLFNAWLGFLITGAMQGVMAAAVASMSVQAIDKVVLVARSMGPSDGMSFVTCCVLLLMAFTVGFLFMKVPSLASGLVGGASLNLDRWSAVGQATGSGLATAGAGAGTVAGEAYKFGRGALEGFGRLGKRASGAAGAAAGSGGGGAAAGAGSPSSAATATRRTPGVSGALGRGAGMAAGLAADAAARAMQRGAPKAFPTSPGAASASPAAGAGAGATAKPAHQPFRPKPGTRPVNRPKPGST